MVILFNFFALLTTPRRISDTKIPLVVISFFISKPTQDPHVIIFSMSKQ